MDKTIGNPVTWAARQALRGSAHLTDTRRELVGDAAAPPVTDAEIARLDYADLGAALRAGWDDLMASRTDALFIVLVYPVIGLVLIGMARQEGLVPLIFPLLSGFALVGPLAALGLYEMSRQREMGRQPNWGTALNVITRPAFGAVLALGLYLIAVMVVWLAVAYGIFVLTLGPQPPASLAAFATATLTTGPGWTMILVGCAVGFCFALLVLATSVVAFPLLLDRPVGLANAVATSLRVTRRNPGVILGWGAIVTTLLILAILPALIGLTLVLPLLGHATWHLYRRAVRPAPH
ncbi:DUF2189 domain-containing protein [Roseivivax sp. CAU 1761]